MMKLVSNTSPIIFLSKLRAAHLLTDCFTEVLIPEAVQSELGNIPLPKDIQLQKISPAGEQYVAGASGCLHQGELEAIVLAKETQADFILLDDLLARRKAKRIGLQVIGTVGLLLLAQKQNLISEKTALDWLDLLIHRHGMYLSAEMIIKIKNKITYKNS